ncbi:hypothetical protein [Paenibacillus pseudetheri]|uniref:Uncharacterized protein n=1 Tax=Paenibacillus pseudetheri TaxID=2897682 RepID=A0ABM9B654_9BACL|nr:hypothetical protein [Paenibacillus pseudetheri]CAH1054044.1 hypothetical protein PAECIP111894_00189 [Paenibacillus pseudetheri]
MFLESFNFMFFSTIEVFAWCALSMSIFRFKVTDYLWQALVVILIMNLQSFVLRNELSLAYLAPLINILFFTLLYSTIVKISLIGSFSITIVGLAGFGIVQAVLALVFFGSIDAAQSNLVYGYILQATTAIIVIPLSWFLYRFGYGFSFDFDKFRLKFEQVAVVTTILFFLIAITAVLYVNETWIAIFFFIASLLFFLRYAMRKEREI